MKNSNTAKALQSKHPKFPRYIDRPLKDLEAWSETHPTDFLKWVEETQWHRRPVSRGDDLSKAGFIRQWYAKHIDKLEKQQKPIDLQIKLPFL
jgi:hypothetical protein